jgi:hypothetical protein
MNNLPQKLDALQSCICNEADEDALWHLFDLIEALRVRAAMKGMRPQDLTPEGEHCLHLLSHNA